MQSNQHQRRGGLTADSKKRFGVFEFDPQARELNKHGVRLPRTAGEQAQVGEAIPSDWRAVSAGDLVMFEDGDRISHVAIYAGRNRIIHASSSGGGVRYDDLSTRRGEWFADHMVAARRVTPDSRGLLLDLARSFSEARSLKLDPPDHAPRPR